MNFRTYIRKYASKVEGGKFYCELCQQWKDKQRWVHYKTVHINQNRGYGGF
jgi:hypothetical protein